MQLVINTRGSYLRKKRNCFLVKNDEKVFEAAKVVEMVEKDGEPIYQPRTRKPYLEELHDFYKSKGWGVEDEEKEQAEEVG